MTERPDLYWQSSVQIMQGYDWPSATGCTVHNRPDYNHDDNETRTQNEHQG